MTGGAVLRAHVRRLRAGQLARYVCHALPLAVLVAFLLVRFASAGVIEALAMALAVVAVQVLAIDLARAETRVTRRRTAQHLDRTHAELEDSTALLLARPSTLSLPARLQRARTGEALLALHASGRLEAATAGRLPRTAAAALVVAALFANLTWLAPRWLAGSEGSVDRVAESRVVSLRVEAQPPEYTRLGTLAFDVPDVSVPEFSILRATLTVAGQYDALAVSLGDGTRVRLYDAGDGRWQTPWWPATATTWQIVDGTDRPVALPGGGIVHAIALVSDTAPKIRIEAPDARLHEIAGLPFELPVRLVVSDDHGVAAVTAYATRATGSGERVSFEASAEPLYDDTDASLARVDTGKAFDGAALGLEAGAEIYLHFEASDARPGGANVARSQTLILRWRDEEAAPEVVLDNAVIQVMPEYFRSQRQIIIDSEALAAERDSLDADSFAARAQSLAIDQKALRLRYGQFLGEEVGGEPGAAPEGGGHFAGDGHDHGAEGEDAGEGAGAGSHYEGDGHEHADEAPGFETSGEDGFGDAMAAIAPYAHFHDQEEQATLFDPETRELLRAALRAMWRSEGELRQFRPGPALPHQYEALALIKRVQNRSRVFVARVGFEPTPVDPGRRLTAELDDIAVAGRLDQRETSDVDARVAGAMRALLERDTVSDASVVGDWLAQELDAARGRGDDAGATAALDARAALDQWRIEPDCGDCRQRLAAFWVRRAPVPPAPAARDTAPLDAFEVAGTGP